MGHLAASVQVPAEAALPHSLELARALRSLTRKVPSRTAFELDEEATVARLVDENIMVPVLRAEPSRWLTLALVVDAGPSMGLWSNEVREFEQCLARLGAFRDVRRWNLFGAEDGQTVELRPHPSVGRQSRHHREIVEPTGNQLIVVLSDAVGSIWRSGAAQRLLFDWASRSQVALAHLLPASLWNRGGATPTPVSLRIPQPGAPNARWNVVLPHRAAIRRRPSLAMPVIELEPQPLRAWADMTAGSGRWTWMSALLLPERSAEPRRRNREVLAPSPEVPPTAEEVIHRFRSSSSPKSWQLAGYLSALSTVTLPVARLVQQAMLTDSTRSELAEVFLGGLLHRLTESTEAADPAEAHFVFTPEVQDALLNSQYSKHVSEVRALVRDRVSAHLESRYGHPRHFPAGLTGVPRHRATVPYVGDAFATPSERGLTRLGERPIEDEPLFLSYAQRDQSQAQRIARALQQAGYSVELDLGRLGPGEDWSLGLSRTLQRGWTVALYSNAYFGPARSSPVDSWTDVIARWRHRLIPMAVEYVFIPRILESPPASALFQLKEAEARHVVLNTVARLTMAGESQGEHPDGELRYPEEAVRGLSSPPGVSNLGTGAPILLGRQREVAEIGRRFANGQQMVALVGPAGVGKTKLALAYAQSTRHRHEITWWVHADSPLPIVNQLAELCRSIGGAVTDDSPEMVAQTLRPRLTHRDWLIVFDGARDPRTVLPHVPRGGRGEVLITSRETEWCTFGSYMTVGGLSQEESVDLLLAAEPRLSTHEAERLAQAMSGLPSDLLEAVRATRSMSADAFLEHWARRGAEPERREGG